MATPTKTTTTTITACPRGARSTPGSRARALALLAALALGACGPAHPGRPAGPLTPRDAVDALPGDTTMVMGVDLTALRRTPVWARFVEPALARPDVAALVEHVRATCHLDPVADVEWIVVGMGPGEGDSAFRLVLRVRFGAAELATCVSRLVPGSTASTQGGLMELTSGDGKRGYVAWLDAHTLLVTEAGTAGDRAALMDVVERGRREPVPAPLAEALPLVDVAAPLWGVGLDSPEWRKDSDYQGPGFRAGAFTLAFPDGILIKALMRFPSDEAARDGKAWIDGALADLRALLPPDILRTELRGRDVHVVIDVPRALSDAFLTGMAESLTESFLEGWQGAPGR